MAPSTLRIRRVQWTCYRHFCQEHHLASIPCSDNQLSLFASYLTKYLSYSSICNYVHAVIFVHRLYGYQPPSVWSSSVKLTLLGIKRKPHIVHDPRAPITLGHLKKLKLKLDLSRPSHTMFWACMLLLFRSLLRVSHITDPPHNLRVQDVCFIEPGMVLVIHSSKTNQGSAPPRYIPIARLSYSSMCAFFWLKRWLTLNPAPFSAPLFSHNGSPISYKLFQSVLTSLVSSVGIKQKISSHSFRRGEPPSCRPLAFQLIKIKERGGWKSNAVLTYIAEPIQVKMKREHIIAGVLNKILN